MKTYIQFVTLSLLFTVSFGCKTDGGQSGFDYGKVENGKYVNAFFDFEMTIPVGWSVQSREQTENLSKIGKDMLTGGDENMKTAIDASQISSANLLAVFKHDLRTAVQYNPNIMVIVENLKNAPDIKTGADYLTNTRNFLKQSQMKHDHIDEAFQQKTIGGAEFYVMNVVVNYGGIQIHQTYYATIQKGFGLVATIAYLNDNEKIELQKAVNSMSFE